MSKIVAVIGASSDRRKFGNKALRAFAHQGYTVVPINPHEREIEGHRAYATVLDVPGTIDMATVYVSSRDWRRADGRGSPRRTSAKSGSTLARNRSEVVEARASAWPEGDSSLQHHRDRRESLVAAEAPGVASGRPSSRRLPLAHRQPLAGGASASPHAQSQANLSPRGLTGARTRRLRCSAKPRRR